MATGRELRTGHWNRLDRFNMATADDDLLLHNSNLSRWIELNGGKIHTNLALHTPLPSPPSDVKDSGQVQDEINKRLTTDYTHRGIFALKGPIRKGEELIRLPATLALDGAALPVSYCGDVSETTSSSASVPNRPRNASNWLRCISSFMHTLYQLEKDPKRSSSVADKAAQKQPSSVDYAHYITSLPKQYDSLLNWTTWEIRSFLAGTALGVNALQTDLETKDAAAETSESQHDDALRLRYRTTVVPYLKYLQQKHGMFLSEEDSSNNNSSSMNSNERETKRQKRTEKQDVNLEELYPLFREGCMCISSRAFHMQLHDTKRETDVDSSVTNYYGPYLLPYIDLLNHSPQTSPKHVTTLRRDTDGSFVMIAERDIAIGEEICHSYDVGSPTSQNESNSSFTSAQTLQTYGFVDLDQTPIIDFLLEGKDKCADGASSSTDAVLTLRSSITPAVLTKSEVCKSCEELSQSTYITELRNLMQQSGMLEEGWEYWELPSLSSRDGTRGDALNNLPDELLISLDASLPDELITMCCLNFLPDDTLDELLQDEDNVLLNAEVLEDFFLGKLVLKAIINAVKAKLKSYKVHVNYSDDADATALLRVLNDVFENENCLDSSSLCWGENVASDARALSKLKSSNARNHPGVDKFIYGLAVSLEERACLIEIRKKACDMIDQI
eukprot:scaffold321_cov110-Skeletonema_dohrnii-CCMP3373.AAC.8